MNKKTKTILVGGLGGLLLAIIMASISFAPLSYEEVHNLEEIPLLGIIIKLIVFLYLPFGMLSWVLAGDSPQTGLLYWLFGISDRDIRTKIALIITIFLMFLCYSLLGSFFALIYTSVKESFKSKRVR